MAVNLFELARYGAPDEINAALKAGADVNARDALGGWTPLHYAAFSNAKLDVTAALIKAGAEVNAKNNGGGTPLHLATNFNRNPAVAAALIEAGAEAVAKKSKTAKPATPKKKKTALKKK